MCVLARKTEICGENLGPYLDGRLIHANFKP